MSDCGKNSATLTPILRQLTSLSSKVRFRKMERCGSASGKIGDLKELIAFQEMAKQLQEISKMSAQVRKMQI